MYIYRYIYIYIYTYIGVFVPQAVEDVFFIFQRVAERALATGIESNPYLYLQHIHTYALQTAHSTFSWNVSLLIIIT
jgi:hypothetical protein